LSVRRFTTNGIEEFDPNMLSDTKLLTQLQAGDVESFEALYLRHYQRIFGVLYRLIGDETEAEDLTQEVFLKLYRSPNRVRVANAEANVAGWLYRVAVNAGYNALRSRHRRKVWLARFGQVWSIERSAASPEQVAASREVQHRVRQVLAQLKPRDAKLLTLRQVGLSYKELAVILDLAPGSIGSLLTRAERAFRDRYQQVFPEEE
jgi:RNA polymerase sigma-70 factor, ECF subfamily